MKTAAYILLGSAAILWHVFVFRLAPRLGLVRPNFRKTPIMASYGIVSFVYVAAIVCWFVISGMAKRGDAALYLCVMAAMWALGAADDIWGSREVGGFAGHFRKLFTQGKITTGAVKAIGGGIVGIAAGYVISNGDPVRWVPAAVLIPLSANLLNLLDLRPGRANAVFFFVLGVTCIPVLGSLQSPWILGAIAGVALLWAIPDSLGRAMMGDSGSNSFGAALGLAAAVNTGVAYQITAIVLIVALHIYSERHSITSLIEHNGALSWIDRKLGVR